MKTSLLLDVSGLAYRVHFASQNESIEDTVGLLHHKLLTSLNKFYKQYKANDVVVCFDTPNSWRKIYTKRSTDKITHKLYKGNRRKNLTDSEKAKLAILDNQLTELAEMFRTQTGILVLKEPYLEADDLVAGFCQKYEQDKNIIISSDKDFIQLLSNGNVTLIDPITDKARDLTEWDNDAAYFMFEKCIRGDIGDNVQSSYPRLPSKKIKIAYDDEFTRTNVMKNKFIVEYLDNEGILQKKKYITEQLFEENKLLMDLTAQPEYIRELIDESITKSIETRGTFNYFSFLKFCGKYELQDILKDVDKFVPLLSGKGRSLSS